MYVEITTRCNFLCAHCVRSCTAEGEDMSLETLEAALTLPLPRDLQTDITLGGGEPTLHPQFQEFVRLAKSATKKVYVVTNGSSLEHLFWLAHQLPGRYCVSDDPWHRAFWTPAQQHWMKAHDWNLRIVKPDEVTYSGRAALWPEAKTSTKVPHCSCWDLHVQPDGAVRACSCPDAPTLGHVTEQVHFPKLIREQRYFCWSQFKYDVAPGPDRYYRGTLLRQYQADPFGSLE